ncbi:hypothetical protein N7492_001717 [Penicillium capsulatum]|uniref:C2H2-type domain-containing protein n=1 Tax=Penicillium capsulatum TaxID=69766 RepID=A0A9W9IV86_9EURO|nr:hypothetical protein N7492_001717 [Penicillium capsulatum]KAJ6129232.1 hypothetical protein N7512_002012 [Penicillium capsulatum]
MDQTSEAAQSSSSMVLSLPEDGHSLETASVYSSPVSATTSHGNGYPNPIGLGISGCGLEPTFNQLDTYANAIPFSVPPALSEQLTTPNTLYNMPLKIDDFSGSTYEIYNGLADSSPLNLYGSQAMCPSSSFNPPIDISPDPTTFPEQAAGYWASMQCPDPTTPSEISPVSASSTMEGQWNRAYFPEAGMALNVPTLSMCSRLSVTNGAFDQASPGGEGDGIIPGHFSTPAGTVHNPPSVTSGEETAHNSPASNGKARTLSPGRKSHAKKRYKCPTCYMTFTRRSNCSEHQKKHDPGFKKSFPCDECHKTFGRNADLKRHTDNVHRKIRKYGCEWCVKRFSRQEALDRHSTECPKRPDSPSPVQSSRYTTGNEWVIPMREAKPFSQTHSSGFPAGLPYL